MLIKPELTFMLLGRRVDVGRFAYDAADLAGGNEVLDRALFTLDSLFSVAFAVLPNLHCVVRHFHRDLVCNLDAVAVGVGHSEGAGQVAEVSVAVLVGEGEGVDFFLLLTAFVVDFWLCERAETGRAVATLHARQGRDEVDVSVRNAFGVDRVVHLHDPVAVRALVKAF